MLEKFTVENYKNFNKPITMDFRQKHDYKFNDDCVCNGLINKMVIYGPNASGKSNLGFALFDIVMVLTDKNVAFPQLDELSFINADSDSKEVRFEYCLKKNEDHIRYAYKKASPTKLLYEELYINDRCVYSYDYVTDERDFSGLSMINAKDLNFDYYEKGFAILRYIANNTQQSADSYVRFIMNFVSNMLWFRSLQDNMYIGFTTERVNLWNWIADNDLASDFQRFLKTIADIDIELDVVDALPGGPVLSIPTRTVKTLVEKHKNSNLRFDEVASSGTKALILFYFWSRRFEQVPFLFIDEFDAFYHYDLSWNIIKYISSLKKTQVVFTTHNSVLASNDLLRPDCYFTLDKGKIVSFIDSTDRELRVGHNLEKMLRNGEFNVE